MTRRIAVVTGGIGGLGSAMCEDLTRQDRTVVAAYYPAEEMKAMEWRERRLAEGLDIAIYPLDVTDFESCRILVEQVVRDLGPIGILCGVTAAQWPMEGQGTMPVERSQKLMVVSSLPEARISPLV